MCSYLPTSLPPSSELLLCPGWERPEKRIQLTKKMATKIAIDFAAPALARHMPELRFLLTCCRFMAMADWVIHHHFAACDNLQFIHIFLFGSHKPREMDGKPSVRMEKERVLETLIFGTGNRFYLLHCCGN